MATVRGVPQSQSTGESPELSRLWWFPLAFVIITLLVLAIVPMVVDQRVRTVRNGVVAASDRARVLLNDLEAAIATEMLDPDSAVAGDGSARHTARLQVAVDADSLELVVGGVDVETSRRFEHLRSLLAGWTKAPFDTSTNAEALTLARAILATADSLDVHLSIVSESRRADVRRLERLDALSAVVLVPIALIAIGVVIWSGQRVLHFARVAEYERAEVVKSTESRTALLRGVTHDLKNPLGAAAGYTQLLADGIVGELTPKQVDMIRRIGRLVDTSVRTVSDLLELARADGAGMHIEQQDVDLTVIAQEVVDDYRGLAREDGLALMFAGSPARIATDAMRVRQVLTNLVSNAIKYTPRGGTVTVSMVYEGHRGAPSRVGVEVRDTGPGIPPELHERVFEEFFRVDGTSRDGNGLGLAISRRLARLLGGDVVYTPGNPCGAVFTLWLDATMTATSDSSTHNDADLSVSAR